MNAEYDLEAERAARRLLDNDESHARTFVDAMVSMATYLDYRYGKHVTSTVHGLLEDYIKEHCLNGVALRDALEKRLDRDLTSTPATKAE